MWTPSDNTVHLLHSHRTVVRASWLSQMRFDSVSNGMVAKMHYTKATKGSATLTFTHLNFVYFGSSLLRSLIRSLQPTHGRGCVSAVWTMNALPLHTKSTLKTIHFIIILIARRQYFYYICVCALVWMRKKPPKTVTATTAIRLRIEMNQNSERNT